MFCIGSKGLVKQTNYTYAWNMCEILHVKIAGLWIGVQKLNQIRKLIREGDAQDLVEYTLILAFVALASAGLFMSAGGSVANIWGAANGALGGSCPPGYVQDGHHDNGAPYCVSPSGQVI
jgi:Flp pilus assembly pilin Flp